MEHLFHGELRQKWWGLKAVGYHHESMMGGGEIVRITHAPNSAGVYKAKVKVDGETKTAFSSFFPKEWDRVQVLDSIKEAYDNNIALFIKSSFDLETCFSNVCPPVLSIISRISFPTLRVVLGLPTSLILLELPLPLAN
ncbi:EndoU domain-containing protein [Bacillus cytotoxicus]|uniref:Bacterial EndoU nuclease domain-containing protein n=1 Tax=Bacillus cytotoxicus TaxID=580165 RepID=A0AAX2CEJ2_9BACI|nr:EndoU domain-containing protein [Bacillus cytotoxicus]SCL87134.1 Uncharacterized protein BCB44BAC_01091 [Bacillus cytotoxicus]